MPAIVTQIDLGEIHKRLYRANYDALTVVSDRMLQDITQYVPKKTGALRESGKVSFKDEDENKLLKGIIDFTWDRPDLTYTTRDGESHTIPGKKVTQFVYEGINPVTQKPIRDYTTSGTGDHWDELALLNEEDNWKDEFTEKFTDSFRTHRK